jgi:Bax protein
MHLRLCALLCAILLSACDAPPEPSEAEKAADAATLAKTRVPPLPDFAAIEDTKAKKQAFFDYLRPLVAIANREIMAERKIASAWKPDQPATEEIRALLSRYDIRSNDPQQQKQLLMRRIYPVPPSMAMAQAASESAWGTSRFAREGNNLFGQWCFTAGCGIVPNRRAPGAFHEVTRFDSPLDAIRSYMLNINTHPVYQTLRQERQKQVARQGYASGEKLAEGLTRYSERGDIYVYEVRRLIYRNKLDALDIPAGVEPPPRMSKPVRPDIMIASIDDEVSSRDNETSDSEREQAEQAELSSQDENAQVPEADLECSSDAVYAVNTTDNNAEDDSSDNNTPRESDITSSTGPDGNQSPCGSVKPASQAETVAENNSVEPGQDITEGNTPAADITTDTTETDSAETGKASTGEARPEDNPQVMSSNDTDENNKITVAESDSATATSTANTTTEESAATGTDTNDTLVTDDISASSTKHAAENSHTETGSIIQASRSESDLSAGKTPEAPEVKEPAADTVPAEANTSGPAAEAPLPQAAGPTPAPTNTKDQTVPQATGKAG